MDFLKKISEKFSLTRTETAVFLFLGVTLIFGAGYRYFTSGQKKGAMKKNDSLLVAAGIQEDGASLNKEENYKTEVLGLDKEDYHKKILPAENSIDINSAGIEDLLRLPGVGEKTAKSILDFRARHGLVEDVNDLIEVKGIGEAKLNKMKKYIYIGSGASN